MLPLPLVCRLARRLAIAWSARAGPPVDPERAWREVDARLAGVDVGRRRLRRAVRHNLMAIVPGLRADLVAGLAALARAVDQVRARLAAASDPAPEPREWVAEIRQLESEFGAVEVRWPEAVIRVVTEPLTLGDVDLGPFAIDFFWGRAWSGTPSRCFEVVALEPNPAAERRAVVHPHVEGTGICLGEATAVVARAVAQGRIADAFVMVRSVLTSYNAESAFVPLDEWTGEAGVACADCGRNADRYDVSACGACGDDLCESCQEGCVGCFASRCAGCLTACDDCGSACCRGCLEDMAETSRCPSCSAKEDAFDDDDPKAAPPTVGTPAATP